MTDHSYGWGDSQEQRLFEGSGEDWPGEPQHGDSGTCGICGSDIEFISATVPLGGVWRHKIDAMPLDHDATLGGPA